MMEEIALELYILSSSESYGYAAALATGQKYNPAGITEEASQSFQDFANLEPEERTILLEAIIYIVTNNNICANHPKWLNEDTQHYNTNNGTNHQPPQNGLEPPMLPPTLARLVLPIIEKIYKKKQQQDLPNLI